jgi:hypothetical protein
MNLGGRYQKLSLAYQKPEIRVPMEIILSVFASLFLITTAIRPTLVTVAELKKKIEDQSLVEKKLGTKIRSLIQARKQLDEYEVNLPLFEKAVPENYTYADLAKKIEIVAAQKKVSIESLIFSSVIVSADEGENLKKKNKEKEREWVNGDNVMKEFTVHFSVTASEAALTSFLKEIETLDRVLVISLVDITKVEEREVIEGKLRASGEMNGYYLVATN